MFNISALLAGAKQIAGHPIAKGGALASLITAGLYAATAAGVAIPPAALALGPLAGYILYRFLPKNVEDEIDSVAQDVTNIANEVPQTYSAPTDFPNVPPGENLAAGTTDTNLMVGQSLEPKP